MQQQINFLVQPVRNCDMEYEGDSRKDKCLKGQNADTPVVKILNSVHCSGVLKVVTVAHIPTSTYEYNLHPNLLCNLARKQHFCNNSGVATYNFRKEMYDEDDCVNIQLKNLCIRHSVKKNFNELKNNFSNSKDKFDPFGVGFSNNQKDVNLEYVKLCCQAFFENNENTEPIVSCNIFNGPADIKIQYWDDERCVNIDSKNELLYVLVRKLSTEQREGICGRFFNNYIDVIIRPELNHHDLAFVFKIPELKNLSIDEAVICNFHLLLTAENKEHYKSETRVFKYIPSDVSRNKRVSENFLNDTNAFQNPNKRPRLNPSNYNDSYFNISTPNETISSHQSINSNQCLMFDTNTSATSSISSQQQAVETTNYYEDLNPLQSIETIPWNQFVSTTTNQLQQNPDNSPKNLVLPQAALPPQENQPIATNQSQLQDVGQNVQSDSDTENFDIDLLEDIFDPEQCESILSEIMGHH